MNISSVSSHGSSSLWRDFGLAWRQLRREFRLSEYLVLIFALVLSVAAVTSVGFFANRVERAMATQAATLLAADAVISSPMPITANVFDRAAKDSLRTANITEFPSVVLTEEGETGLVSVKAVDSAYPLRGELKLTQELFAEEREATDAPSSGSVWIDPRLAGRLQVAVARLPHQHGAKIATTALIGNSP